MRLAYILKQIDGVPDEFQLLPYGQINIEGEAPATNDEESMQSIIADFQRRGNEMVIDYEHQTLSGGQAPAAGWIKRLIDKGKDGLWAAVEWTQQAKEYLKNKEYKYFSPVMWVAKQGRKVVKIENVALTNFPKVNNLRPIIAKMTLDEERQAQDARSKKYNIGVKDGGSLTKPSQWQNVPDDEWLDPVNYRYPCPDAGQTRAAASYWGQSGNQAQYNPEERSVINGRLDSFEKKFGIGQFKKEGAKMITKLRKILVLADDAGEDKVLAAAEQLVAAKKDLEQKPVIAKQVLEALDLQSGDVSVVVASIHALKQAGKGAVSREEFEKIQGKLLARDVDEAVTGALSVGKITPEQKQWAEEYAKRDLEGFKLFVTKAPVVVPVNKLPGAKEKTGDGGALDDVQLSINKMMGISDETWKKYSPQPH
jgi:phage I-like protein